MKTSTRKSGEILTTWTSHKHPENPNFMQVVQYMHIQHLDGRSNLHWNLFNCSANDRHLIGNISLDEAKQLYMDVEDTPITEEDFQKWLNK